MRLREGERVLVRMPSWVGDFVMAEPALRAVVEHVESRAGSVSVVLQAAHGALLEGRFPGLRRIVLGPSPSAAARDWRGHDLALLFTGSFRSAWSALCAGIPRRAGWARDGRGWLLGHSMRPPLERGAVPLGLGLAGRGRRFLPRPFGSSCVELASSLGVTVRDTRPRLTLSDSARETVGALLGEAGLGAGAEYLVANVGGRAGSAKGLRPAQWARLLDETSPGMSWIVVAGPGEEELVPAVLRQAQQADLRSLGTTLDLHQLAALAARSSAFVTTDGGPRHVAAAVGARVLCLFGPTDPRHTADHLQHTISLREVVPCGPCHLELCPRSGDLEHLCMRSISPQDASRALGELLSRPAAAALP